MCLWIMASLVIITVVTAIHDFFLCDPQAYEKTVLGSFLASWPNVW